MQFVDAVNRILRLNAVIRGDTDTVATFSDTAHNATLNLAIIAIQDELTDLVADRIIGYEFASGTITTISSQRTYALPSDFIRFYGQAFFLDGTREIFEYSGGREKLQVQIPNYKNMTGTPTWWYWEPGTTRSVGFYQIPNGVLSLAFDYEKSVMVTNSTDTMPFQTTEEQNAFCAMAGRRFKFLYEDVENKNDIIGILENDMSYRRARRTLFHVIKGSNPPNRYAPAYR